MLSSLPYTIMGAGHYGLNLAGNVLARNQVPNAELVAYVDPYPDIARIRDSVVGRLKGIDIVPPATTPSTSAIPLFTTLSQWASHFNVKQNPMVVDLALRPHIVPQAFTDCVNAGVKKIILPKPLSFDVTTAQAMEQTSDKEGVQAAVASNWFYSEITQDAGQVLAQVRKRFRVLKAELNYSKQNEKVSGPPAHDELPHALQIAVSTGLINPEQATPNVFRAEPQKISTHYDIPQSDAGLTIHTFTDSRQPSPSGRIRELKIWLDDDDPEPDIVVNYDVLIDRQSQEMLKPGSLTLDIQRGPEHITQHKEYRENTLQRMYSAIQNAFHGSLQAFNQNPAVLTLKNYLPLIHQISMIHQQWVKLLPNATHPAH